MPAVGGGGGSVPLPRRLWPLLAAGIALPALPRLQLLMVAAAAGGVPPRLARPLPLSLEPRHCRRGFTATRSPRRHSGPPLLWSVTLGGSSGSGRLLAPRPAAARRGQEAGGRRQEAAGAGAQAAGNAPQPGRAAALRRLPRRSVSDAPGSPAAAAAPGQLPPTPPPPPPAFSCLFGVFWVFLFVSLVFFGFFFFLSFSVWFVWVGWFCTLAAAEDFNFSTGLGVCGGVCSAGSAGGSSLRGRPSVAGSVGSPRSPSVSGGTVFARLLLAPVLPRTRSHPRSCARREQVAQTRGGVSVWSLSAFEADGHIKAGGTFAR